MRLFIVILLVLLPSFAYASPDNSVFGIKIGEPFSIPDCEPGDVIASKKLCAITSKSIKTAWGTTDIEISFPDKDKPDFLKALTLSVSILDGKVESVSFATNGNEYQNEVLKTLVAKYGKPKKLKKISVRNSFNTTYIKYSAVWSFAAFTVTFEGIDDELDWGNVEVSSNKYRKLLKEWEKKSDESKTKL